MSFQDILATIVCALLGVAVVAYVVTIRRWEREARAERIAREARWARSDEEMAVKLCALWRTYGQQQHGIMCDRCRTPRGQA